MYFWYACVNRKCRYKYTQRKERKETKERREGKNNGKPKADKYSKPWKSHTDEKTFYVTYESH